MKIELYANPFNPWEELNRYQNEHNLPGRVGATCVFVGTMRDFNEGDGVTAMFLEHYPQMTAGYMQKIAAEAQQRWQIEDVLMIHRYGDIQPNDTIVLLAAWSAHREAAFDACRYLIEELKTRAPFWKKETLLADNSTRWVQGSVKT
ncbi:molybdenum cofactor biosynthesis protein MoaE [Kaarinaea lacus]